MEGIDDRGYEPPEEEEPPEWVKCMHCIHCEETPDDSSKYGWCRIADDWVLLNEYAIEDGCSSWELRPEYKN